MTNGGGPARPISRQAPRWWRGLVRIAAHVAALLLTSLAAAAGVLFADLWSNLPAPFRAGVAHVCVSWLYAVLVLGSAETLYQHLFLRSDLGYLLTCPIREGGILRLKLLQFARGAGFGVLSSLPLLWGFVLGQGGTSFDQLLLVPWLLLAAATILVPAVALALVQPLRRLLSALVTAVTIGGGVLVVLAALYQRWSFFESHFYDDPHAALWVGSPGVWLGDCFALLVDGSWAAAAGFAVRALGLGVAAAAAIVWLAPRRYRRTTLLEIQERGSAAASEGGPTWTRLLDFGARGESRGASRPAGPLARWLRRRWSDRTRAVVRLITRRPQPERIEGRLLASGLLFALAWLAGRATEIAIRTAGDVEPGGTLVGYGMAFLIAYSITLVPSGLRRTVRPAAQLEQLRRMSLRERTSLAHVGVLLERGDHSHPLIETFPISLPRFTLALVAATAAEQLAVLLVSAPFVLLTPLRASVELLLLLGVAIVVVYCDLAMACSHAASLQQHPSRSRLRSLLIASAVAAGAIFLTVAGAALLAVAIPTEDARWILLSALALLLLLVASAPLLSLLHLVHRNRNRWFDAEYRQRPLTSPQLRW